MMSEVLNDLRAGRLQGATRLNLQAGLTSLPPEVYDLADTLEVLDLSGNALTALPHDLPRLRKLRVLFCSDNPFTTLPEVIGDCPSLTMVGFKACRIEHVPPAALPAALHWLVLTDNRIHVLPDALGRCDQLQKLMLAGNQLVALPDALGDCQRLELVRVSANALQAVPGVLLDLPRLAWLACGGNPWSASLEAVAWGVSDVPKVDAAQLAWGACLGQGASGVIHAVQDAAGQTLAAKLFKGEMTSDGLPQTEMAACTRVGAHPQVLGAVARLVGHSSGREGLLMQRMGPQWVNLAGPPSLESCTRDVYPPEAQWSVQVALSMAKVLAQALAHVHACGLMHGDVYAHNVMHDGQGNVRLGDFGAATVLPPDQLALMRKMQALDVRALGYLLEELIDHCADGPQSLGALPALRDACLQQNPLMRPLSVEVAEALDEGVGASAY
jgi:Protein kinase domain/Leucine Rich repeats (2 copies)